MRIIKLLSPGLFLIIATIGQANETEVVNKFYGAVLKTNELRASLEEHQSTRKSEMIEVATNYKTLLGEKLDTAAEAGDLALAKDCRDELDLVEAFILNLNNSSKDVVSEILTAPKLPGLNVLPPAEIVGFRQDWDRERIKVLAGNQTKLKKELTEFIGKFTKQRNFDDAQAVSDFKQLVADRHSGNETILEAFETIENPASPADIKRESGCEVIYPGEMYSYHSSALVNPSKHFWVDGNQGRGTLYLRVRDDRLANIQHDIDKSILAFQVSTFGEANTSHYIRVHCNGKQVGIKKGASKGQDVQIPLNLAEEIQANKELILKVTCGTNGMGIVATGRSRPRLLVDF